MKTWKKSARKPYAGTIQAVGVGPDGKEIVVEVEAAEMRRALRRKWGKGGKIGPVQTTDGRAATFQIPDVGTTESTRRWLSMPPLGKPSVLSSPLPSLSALSRACEAEAPAWVRSALASPRAVQEPISAVLAAPKRGRPRKS